MHNQSVNELRFLFLEQIAIKPPEASAKLFEFRDAGKWQAEYHVSADWLETFLRAALEEEQEHMDSIAKQVDARTALATPIYWRNNPAGYATFGRVKLPIYIWRVRAQLVDYTYWRRNGACVGYAQLVHADKAWQVSAAAAAWLRTLKIYRASHEIWREVAKKFPRKITYLDPAEDKRRVERQCHWSISFLFGGMSDEEIRQAAGVGSWQIVCRTRHKFADTIELTLISQQGRRRKRKRNMST
jgi:hypothetical protein